MKIVGTVKDASKEELPIEGARIGFLHYYEEFQEKGQFRNSVEIGSTFDIGQLKEIKGSDIALG